MKTRRLELAGVALLVGGALVLRLLTYRSVLPPDINNDEFAWAWAGQGIWLHHGIPNAWSYLAGYPPPSVMANPVTHAYLPWQPRWVDDPPLFAALVGLFERLAGEVHPAQSSIAVIRLVPTLCSTACVALLYALLRRHAGAMVAALAAALLAFTPTALRASALTEAEWLLAPVLIGALLLVGSRRPLGKTALLFLCTIAPLVKVTGVAVPVAVVVILLIQRQWALALPVTLAGLLGVGLVIAWGAFVDWHLFQSVMRSQAARHEIPTNPLGFLLSDKAGPGHFVPWHDPVWYAGVGSVGAMTVASAARRRWIGPVVVIPVAVVSVLMALIAPGVAIYYNGWYRIMVYPLVYGAAAWVTVTTIRAARGFATRRLAQSPGGATTAW